VRVYIKSLLVGLCAAAVVLGVFWSAATRPPWYVSTLAALALVTASGWQLRRSLRDRR
jgi:hypothetical protein